MSCVFFFVVRFLRQTETEILIGNTIGCRVNPKKNQAFFVYSCPKKSEKGLERRLKTHEFVCAASLESNKWVENIRSMLINGRIGCIFLRR